MKPLLAILGVSMGLILAVPAHADPGDRRAAQPRQRRGLSHRPPESGYRLLGLEPGRQRRPSSMRVHPQRHVRSAPDQAPGENNPGLTENGAAQFATISAKAYCPRLLDESEEPGDQGFKKKNLYIFLYKKKKKSGGGEDRAQALIASTK